MSDYSVADYMAETGRAARAATIGSLDDDPDQAARAIELGDSAGVPAEAVYPDVDGFERAYKSNLSANLIQGNPHLAEYLLSHPMAPKVSHDDLGQLDELSEAVGKLQGKTRFQKWLESDSISQSFMEGFGDQPLGSTVLSRPQDLEWALSHPLMGSVAMAAATPVELMSRAVGGLVHMGHDGLEAMFGKSFADEMAGLAEYSMMRGDIGVHAGGGGASGPLVRAAENQKLREGMRQTAHIQGLTDPWTKAGEEPPPGLHPLIDKAKGLQAKDDIKLLEEALSAAQKSATRERASELLGNFIRLRTGEREIGLSAEAVERLYEGKTPEAGDNILGWVPEIAEKFDAARLTGEDLKIPIADWLAKVDPEVAKALSEDIRVRDRGMTVAETKTPEGAEPLPDKTVAQDPVQQIRGMAGLEPKEMAGDRFVRLERVQRDPNKPMQPWEQGMHDVNIYNEYDEPVGTINISEQAGGKDLYVEMIRAGSAARKFYQPNYLGPRLIIDIRRQLKNMFPNAERVGGHRVTGAREAAGSWESPSSMVWVKLDATDGWAHTEGMRDLLQGVWEREGGYDFFRGPMTLDQQVLAEAVRKELERIVPSKLAGVETPLAVRKVGGRDVGGLYRRFMNRLPDIVAALDRDDAVSVARHEAIHHLRGYGFFTDREWAMLERTARDNGWLKRFGIDERYPTLDMPGKLEEAIAEGFRAWARGERAKPEVHGIFERLKQFFENIKTAFKEATGRELNWEEVFRKVDSGEVGSREGTGAKAEGGVTPFDVKAAERGDSFIDEVEHQQMLDYQRGSRRASYRSSLKGFDSDIDLKKYINSKDPGMVWHIVDTWEARKPKILDMPKDKADTLIRQMGELEKQLKDGGEYTAFKVQNRGKFNAKRQAIREQYNQYREMAGLEPIGTGYTDPEWGFQNIEGTHEPLKSTDLPKLMELARKGPDFVLNTRSMSEIASDAYREMGGTQDFAPKEMADDGLYESGKALGVTQTHMQRMLRLIEKRNAEDRESAQRKAELRQRRRSNKEYKERRATLQDEVRDQLRERPDLALDELFARQKIKFNPAYLSEDQRARLPKDYLEKKNGINPDDIAPYFGYTSGDALVERLGILTEDRRRAGMSQRDYFNRLVDVETDRRLNQEFGNREQNILDEATDQALSETQINLVHEETMAHAMRAGVEPEFDQKQVQAMVKQSFDQQPVGSLNSRKLLMAAGRIGKKIEEAAAKGDWATAYRLSQQRNHAVLYAKYARDYEKARASFERTAKTFRKREVPSVTADYTNWIHDILQRVGKPVNRSVQDLAENIGRQTEQSLQDFVEAKEAEWMGLRELPVADYLLDPNFRKPVDELTHQDFMGLKNSIDALIKAGRDERTIYREGEARDRAAVMSEMRDKLATFGYKPSKAELGDGIASKLRDFVFSLTNMETILNRWDRNDPRGIFNRYIVYPLAEAANGKARLQREIAKAYKDLSNPKDLDKLVDSPLTDPMTRTEDNPNGSGTWSGFRRSHVLQMLNNAGNKSNWRLLAEGYGTDPEALMQWLFRNTTKEDWDRAQQLGDTVFKPLVKMADRVYERMTGATIEKIPLEPIKTPYGTYEGWYHPAVADPVRKTVWKQDADTGLWEQQAQGKRDTLNDTDFFHFSTANGYTKRRTGAIYPLDLNFNMTPTRIKQMIHDISFREVVHEAQKIFSDPRFREDVAKYYGKEYAEGLMPYLRDVAGAEGINAGATTRGAAFSEYLRQNVISTYIGFNPFTVMKHGPTAAVMSSREVGTVEFAEAVKALYAQAPSTARTLNDFVLKNSEEIQRRERHWQDTIAGQGREITGAGNLREKIIEAGSAAVAWSDMVSAKPTWLAAYRKAQADGLSHGEAVALSDRAVRRAHGSTAETNQPAIVRGGGALHSWLTSVYGFFGTAMQRRIETAYKINDAYKLGREGEIKKAGAKAGSAFVDFMTYMVWPTIVEELVTGIGSDDHRTWGSRLISGATMGAASSVIYLRDLVHGLVSGHEPGVGLLSSAAHDVGNVFRDATRGREAFNRQHAGKTIGDLITVTGEATGMAPKVVGNAARYGINVYNRQEVPRNISDVLLGVTKGSQKRRVEK